jgi:hypothetical protein
VWPSQQLREQEQASKKSAQAASDAAREAQLRKEIADYEHKGARTTARHARQGVGTDAAPLGGARHPSFDVPTPRRDPRYPPGGRVTPLSGGPRRPVGLPGTDKQYKKYQLTPAQRQQMRRDELAEIEERRRVAEEERVTKEDKQRADETIRDRSRLTPRSTEDDRETRKQADTDRENTQRIIRERSAPPDSGPGDDKPSPSQKGSDSQGDVPHVPDPPKPGRSANLDGGTMRVKVAYDVGAPSQFERASMHRSANVMARNEMHTTDADIGAA